MDKDNYMDLLKDIVVDAGKSPNQLQEEREANLEILNEEESSEKVDSENTDK